MPKNEKHINDESDQNIEVVESKNDEISDQTDRRYHHKNPKKTFVILLSTTIVVLVIAVAGLAGHVMNLDRGRFVNQPTIMNSYVQDQQSPRMGRMQSQRRAPISTVNTDITNGVVISVGSNSFEIGGNGNQYTVNTTDTTEYNTTTKKVAVGDSVIVSGTVTDKTITATDVRIVNY
ncbi:MAG: DUF5666 domain-containing protein [Candidatus Saccharibacteria bacterium]